MKFVNNLKLAAVWVADYMAIERIRIKRMYFEPIVVYLRLRKLDYKTRQRVTKRLLRFQLYQIRLRCEVLALRQAVLRERIEAAEERIRNIKNALATIQRLKEANQW